MLVPTVTEDHMALEPVRADPFVADLTQVSAETEARLAALVRSAGTAPRRLVYD